MTTTSKPNLPHAGMTAGASSNSAFKPEIPRRVVEVPGVPPRREPPAGVPGLTASAPVAAPAPAAPFAPAAASATAAKVPDMRKLIVGREISLAGEITACDVLVVEGTVEAKLRDGHSIEITQGGLFKGSVEINDADIGGRFEGDLVVRGRLRVRSSGRIQGSIKYGELEVEAGGQLIGDIQVMQKGQKDAPAAKAAGASGESGATVQPIRSSTE